MTLRNALGSVPSFSTNGFMVYWKGDTFPFEYGLSSYWGFTALQQQPGGIVPQGTWTDPAVLTGIGLNHTRFPSKHSFLEKIRFYLFTFRELGRVGEREGEKHQCERETSSDYLPYVPWQGPEPATQVCALTRNQPVTFHFAGWCPTNWATLLSLPTPTNILYAQSVAGQSERSKFS